MGKLQDKITYDKAIAVSDFVHANLQPSHYGDEHGTVFVNLDSYWDNLSDAQHLGRVAAVEGEILVQLDAR